jgi:hypothetical protein
MWPFDEYFFLMFNCNPKCNVHILTLLLDFFLGICHGHLFQQEIQLYKVVKDSYVVPIFNVYTWHFSNFSYRKCIRTSKHVQILIRKPMMCIMCTTKTQFIHKVKMVQENDNVMILVVPFNHTFTHYGPQNI